MNDIPERKKRPQRRFESKSEIEKAIDAHLQSRDAADQAAIFNERLAEKYRKDAATKSDSDAAILFDMADEQLRIAAEMKRRSDRIGYQLEQLKRTLAAFQTTDMFADQSINLQNSQ